MGCLMECPLHGVTIAYSVCGHLWHAFTAGLKNGESIACVDDEYGNGTFMCPRCVRTTSLVPGGAQELSLAIGERSVCDVEFEAWLNVTGQDSAEAILGRRQRAVRPNDYSDAARSIIKVRFPEAKEFGNGSWAQRWRIETAGDVHTRGEALSAAEKEMGQADFEVRIDAVGLREFDLLITTRADAKQGRFLFAIYNALLVFDRSVARIAVIEGQPREHWTPFRFS